MPITTAILVFDEVQIIDYTGPYEVLGRRGPTYLVAETLDPITTNMGMRVVPNYAFGQEPKPDVLVIPGGGSSGEPETRRYGVGVAVDNEKIIDWIRSTAASVRCVLSVCNGAFLANRAGLLDGLTATTTAGYIDYLASVAPRTKVVRDQRVVDNGKVLVTGGLSAGIDGALRVVEKLESFGTAVETALHMEYDWRPNDGWARAALADNRVPAAIYAPFYGDGTELLEFETGLERAHEVWSAVAKGSPAELVERIDAAWAGAGWAITPNGPDRSIATGRAADGSEWRVEVGVEPAPVAHVPAADAEPRQRVTVEVVRLSSAS